MIESIFWCRYTLRVTKTSARTSIPATIQMPVDDDADKMSMNQQDDDVFQKSTTIVRWLPRQGICPSRKAAAELLSTGRVTVNEVIVKALCFPITQNDTVRIDYIEIQQIQQIQQQLSARHVHIMMHKAPNTLCGRHNIRQLPGGERQADTRATVYDGLPPGIQCMGRLDLDTTGLLLFTTDGLLNHALVNSSFKVPKVYQCTLRDQRTPLSLEAIETLHHGVTLPNGHWVSGKAWNHELERGIVFLQITNGYHHQVKHMLRFVGRPLALLHRCDFAGLSLDPTLCQSAWRHLTEEEVHGLYDLARRHMATIGEGGSL